MNGIKRFNFARGHPNRSLLPTHEIQAILNKVAVDTVRLSASLNYGDEEGNSDFLSELNEFLKRRCETDEYPDDRKVPESKLFATHGVSHGVELISATLASAGDLVLVENPTYFLVAGIFKAHNLKVESLPMQAHGIDFAELQERLKGGMKPKFVYVIPSHQNPTARTMNLGDRIKLCNLAERYDFTVIADEVYHLLDWRILDRDGKRPARFSSLSSSAISISSFTKIFGPGLRCGWIEGPLDSIRRIKQYGYIGSQGGCVPFIGNLMRTALETRLADEVLNKLNAAYCKRVELLVGILLQDDRLEIAVKPLGGYFVWIRLFSNELTTLKASDFLDYCCERGISFLPGDRCDPSNSGSLSQCIRLCFADLDETDLKDGAELFVLLYRRFCDDQLLSHKIPQNSQQ